MKLLLVPRADEPSIAAGWVAHVGSANERPGITGISHLFEHMMFKGTKTIGAKDAARDLELIDEQETRPRPHARGGRDAARGPPARRDRRHHEAREQDGPLPGAREGVRRAREGAARPPRQERVRPDLHEGRRGRDERLDEHGPHAVLRRPCRRTSSSSGSGWSRTACARPSSASSTPSATSSSRSAA